MHKRVITKYAFYLISFFVLTSTVQGRWLIVNSLPGDARVLVNDADAGNTPVKLEGKEGDTVTITVISAGLEDYSFAYDFSEDKVIFLDLVDRVELDESTYWQKKTSDNTRQVKDILPTATPESILPTQTPEPLITLPPELRETGEPDELPTDLFENGYKGLAVFEVNVKANGKIKNVDLMTDVPDKAVRRYLDGWVDKFKFNPATENSEPIKQTIQIKIIYDFAKGQLQLPDYNKLIAIELPVNNETLAETDTPDTEPGTDTTTAPTAVPVTQTTQTSTDTEGYFTAKQVDRPAKVFTPPTMGNISVDIINLNLKGSATFNVFIGESGDVDKVETIQSTGNNDLDQYVMKMIKKSFWEPAKKGGNPVKFVRPLKLEFYTLTCRFDFPNIFD